MAEELVSVVMPMRNAERFVVEAVRSVLDQQDVRVELVVVDDGSTDASRALVEGFSDPRIRIVEGPRRGIAAAMAAGLAATEGAYFVRCDADDAMAPGRLARQIGLLSSRPEAVAVCGQFCTISDKGATLAEMGSGDESCDVSAELRTGFIRTHLGTFLTRMAVARTLGFREPLVIGEDIDFVLRIGEQGPVWYDANVVYRYRLHGSSATHTEPSAKWKHFDELVRDLQKQRLQTGTDDLMKGLPLPPPPDDEAKTWSVAEHAHGVLIGAAWRYRQQGRHLRALWTNVRACFMKPADAAGWKSFFALMLK
jgi:glycosyltransferase involved in cell wall biosynthesis